MVSQSNWTMVPSDRDMRSGSTQGCEARGRPSNWCFPDEKHELPPPTWVYGGETADCSFASHMVSVILIPMEPRVVLEAFDRYLERHDLRLEGVVIGGTALNLLGV